MSRTSSATPCIWAGRGGWPLTGPLSNFIHKLETALRTKWLPRALFYGLIVAALFLVWLYTDGESVAFVYSEF